MLLTMVILLYFIVILLDFIPVWRQRQTKQTLVYGALLAVSFTILVLYSLNIPVISPTEDIIRRIVEAIQ